MELFDRGIGVPMNRSKYPYGVALIGIAELRAAQLIAFAIVGGAIADHLGTVWDIHRVESEARRVARNARSAMRM